MTPDEHRAKLEDLRDKLEAALSVATENMLPQLAGQYRATLDDLAKIEVPKSTASVQDELRRRREQRRKKTG